MLLRKRKPFFVALLLFEFLPAISKHALKVCDLVGLTSCWWLIFVYYDLRIKPGFLWLAN